MVQKSPPVRVSDVRKRVDSLLAERRQTAKWLYDTLEMSKTGYREMWDRETVRLVVLVQIAEALEVTLDHLLHGLPIESTAADPPFAYGTKRFLEERVEDLERAVDQLRRKQPVRT